MLNRKVQLKSEKDLETMRVVCKLAAETLCAVDEILKPGITTEDINRFVHEDTLKKGCVPAPLNYRGFPKSVCTSVNEVVCHGIPSGDQVLQDGDIINVDVTHIYKGFHGDTSATFFIGSPSKEAIHVTEVSRRSRKSAYRPCDQVPVWGTSAPRFRTLSRAWSFGCAHVHRAWHRPRIS